MWCSQARQATHCNTLQCQATHCNTPQHTATHCNTLQHTATHCNTLHHTAVHCNALQHSTRHCNTRERPRRQVSVVISGRRVSRFDARFSFTRLVSAIKERGASVIWLLFRINSLSPCVLQSAAVCYKCVAGRCNVLQCVAVCCSE